MATQTDADVLGKYKGKKILGTSVKVTNLGDGLSKAVGVEPVVIDCGTFTFIGVKARKLKDTYEASFDAQDKLLGFTLIQHFSAIGATFVDNDAMEKAIHATMEAVALAEAERKEGQRSFSMDSKDDDEIGRKVDEALD